MIRILISGGPGSGCTSTAQVIGRHLRVPVFDSDVFFHKPTDPPFQEQYTPEERRTRLGSQLSPEGAWILSGSVATWGLDPLEPTHGIFLNIPKAVRLRRLVRRQRDQFGTRIDSGGDMHQEHHAFMKWAEEYEIRTGPTRSAETDHAFLKTHCKHLLVFSEEEAMDGLVAKILRFLG